MGQPYTCLTWKNVEQLSPVSARELYASRDSLSLSSLPPDDDGSCVCVCVCMCCVVLCLKIGTPYTMCGQEPWAPLPIDLSYSRSQGLSSTSPHAV